MSAIVFQIGQDYAVVATDTLAVTPDGMPWLFFSKALYLPHIRTIIAGTGVGNFASEWCAWVNTNARVRDVDELNTITPASLTARWAVREASARSEIAPTATIYCFGVTSDRLVRAYAYRSTSNFAAEELQAGGTYFKPPCQPPVEGKSFLAEIPRMMNEQRSLQSTEPLSSQLHIGGEIAVMVLTADGCHATTLGRFDDYERHLAVMRSRG